MNHSVRIAASALVIAGTIALFAPITSTTALLTDRETAHVRVVGAADAPVETGCATRTHGFWLAHPALTAHVLEEHLSGRIECGPLVLTSSEGVLGALAADPKRDSSGEIRDKLERARVLCTRQLVAGILSGAFSNAAPVPLDTATGVDLIAAARSALDSSDARECLRLAELLDAYLQAHCDEEFLLDCGYVLEPDQLAIGTELANTSVMDSVNDAPVATTPEDPSASTSDTTTPADLGPDVEAPAPASELNESSAASAAIDASVPPSPE